MSPQEITALAFNINCKQGHFRKYNSNSSALSYYIPPVITIKGIIAQLLGYERNTYYEILDSENCKIGISIEVPIKKITQTMNLISAKNKNELCDTTSNRTQVGVEFILPKNKNDYGISYKIYFYHKDKSIMDKLKECVCENYGMYKSFGGSLFLGSAQCGCAWISDGEVITLHKLENNDDFVKIDSAIRLDYIKAVNNSKLRGVSLIKDECICDLNKDRAVKNSSKIEVQISTKCMPYYAKLRDIAEVYSYKDDKNICFLI